MSEDEVESVLLDSEAQRVAVSIGDWIGGCVDTTTSVCHGPSGIAFQDVGEVTCTLGEIKNRGDLIIFWGSNPAESHPRHFTKYSLMPKGLFVPRGRKDRYCVLVDVRKTKCARAADLFIPIKPRKDFEALWVLRALAKWVELDPAEIEAETGVPLATWQALMDRMKKAKYGVILFGMGLTLTRGKHLNSYALLALARDMNAHTRFVCKPMRGHGNVTGADNVVTWRTGYPFAVNLARGYPRFNPGEYTTADTLGRGEADAAMIIASDPMSNFSQAAREHLARIPAYPQIIRLLMDRTYRQDMLKTVPRKIREQNVLADLDRQYSRSEIAIITRAGPARILGLKNKGHLGPGADADITIYTPDPNQETMFELPRFVIKAGRVIVEQGEIREETYGKTLHVAPDYDHGVEPDIQRWFEDSYSIRYRNYPVEVEHLHEHEVVE